MGRGSEKDRELVKQGLRGVGNKSRCKEAGSGQCVEGQRWQECNLSATHL